MRNPAVEEIKERLPIEEVVSSYIKLEKTGINMRACCPFHNEKTPSFFISPDRGSFYCFGCGKGGDIFTFVQEIEGVDFKGALKILAEKAGVNITEYRVQSTENKEEVDVLYEILEKATIFFETQLQNNTKASDYIKSRGINETFLKRFRVGYSKDEWQSLYDYLKTEGFSDEKIINSGLVIKNETGRIYDRFRGRIIFPIFDDKGRAVAFTARILTNEKESLHAGRQEPKYINSPETSLFNKSKILYGFNFAKQTIRKHDFAILVEGQLDVIMTHQIGYTNTVASSGTAFTEEQLKIIKRHTNNLLISFDGDSAGIKSSKKVWELALQSEMDVKVIPLKEGQDPADIIFNNPDEWKKVVKNSRHIIEHFADNIQNLFQDKRKQQKEVQKEIYPYLRNIKSYTDKSYFVDKISEMFGIDKEAIWNDINIQEYQENKEDKKHKEEKKREVNAREILYGIYLSQELKDKGGYFNEIKKHIQGDLFVEMDKRKEKILFETDLLLNQYGDLKKLSDGMFSKLLLNVLEKEKENLNFELRNLGEDYAREKEIMKRLASISREIETVKKKGCKNLLNMV